ncbi:hypothetical protein BZA77DRAFT_293386 [Pyronema omphalodes]|nr:hypothetical protein BZA77DRAFT_293386 [Pyronema omphalodes]
MKFHQAISILFLFIISISFAAPIGKPLTVAEPVAVEYTTSEGLLHRSADPSGSQNQAISTVNSNGKTSSSSSVAVVNSGEGAQTTVGTPEEAQEAKNDKKKQTDTIIGSVRFLRKVPKFMEAAIGA